ncbi:MAG: hypothetical protein ACKVX7_20545 [Planctomycetota bacterium]
MTHLDEANGLVPTCLNNLSRVAAQQGKRSLAERLDSEALELSHAGLGGRHSFTARGHADAAR